MALPPTALGFQARAPSALRTRTGYLGLGDPGERGLRYGPRSRTHFPGGDCEADGTSSSLIPALLLLPRARPGGLQLPMSGDLPPGESVFHVRERVAAWGRGWERGGGTVREERAERRARGRGWDPEGMTETPKAGGGGQGDRSGGVR